MKKLLVVLSLLGATNPAWADRITSEVSSDPIVFSGMVRPFWRSWVKAKLDASFYDEENHVRLDLRGSSKDDGKYFLLYKNSRGVCFGVIEITSEEKDLVVQAAKSQCPFTAEVARDLSDISIQFKCDEMD